MNSRIAGFLSLAAVLFFSALVILAIPSFSDPEFKVVNHSPEAVSVVAAWRRHERNIGRIEPMSSLEFTIDDEAAISFIVRYSTDREMESEQLYFTSGTKVIAVISDDGIELRYDFDI